MFAKTQANTTPALWFGVDGDEDINMLPTLELLRCFHSLQLTALAYNSPSTSTSLAQDLALFCILEHL